MWHRNFSDRLEAWSQLKRNATNLDALAAVSLINRWWQQTPWKPYYLHWEELDSWPDPWQLLNDNIYCELARGLGILYTISMINHPDLTSAELVLTESDRNLVLVNKSKYILNWDGEVLVNTRLPEKNKKSLTQEEVTQKYN